MKNDVKIIRQENEYKNYKPMETDSDPFHGVVVGDDTGTDDTDDNTIMMTTTKILQIIELYSVISQRI